MVYDVIMLQSCLPVVLPSPLLSVVRLTLRC